MTMTIDRRPSDIAFVDEIWRGRSDGCGSFVSGAATYWELVVTQNRDGSLTVTIRGPGTRALPLAYDGGGAWWGIRFRMGSHLAHVPNPALVDSAISLPVNGHRSFVLHRTEFPLPDYENAEATVHRLVRSGVLVYDAVVDAAWQGSRPAMSQRSLQRRFRHVTGISQRTAHQIDRARTALRLLVQGVSILDTVHELGYSDQAHLTRSLHRWMGCTPAQVVRERRSSMLA